MRKLAVYWYQTTDNFGDAFSPMAVAHCFGCDVVSAGKRNAGLVAEGSVLGFTLLRDLSFNPFVAAGTAIRAVIGRCHRPLLVWGSGMLFPLDRRKRKIAIRRPRFLALRGELTRREMVGCGLLDAGREVALGDPGLFMPDVLKITWKPTWRRGLVLHACSWQDGTAAAFAHEHPEIKLIDPRRSPADVVLDIAACSEIFSSSLHGLVVADALGIPNRWVALQTSHASDEDNRFKFNDYYSAFGAIRVPCRLKEVMVERPREALSSKLVEACKSALRDAARDACRKLNGGSGML